MHSAPYSPQYSLEALHAMPCGCVAGVYRTLPWDVEVISLETLGPHCRHDRHAHGEVLVVGQPERTA